jgi:hypothetical protein
MSRNTPRSTGRRQSGRKVLSKSMLLPIPRNAVTHISLVNHLALVACRGDDGNAHLMNELLRAVYLSYFLQQGGAGDATVVLYKKAEAGLEVALKKAHREKVWHVNDDLAALLEGVLATYGQQLQSAASWMLIRARECLDQFISSDRQSPIAAPTLRIQTDGLN